MTSTNSFFLGECWNITYLLLGLPRRSKWNCELIKVEPFFIYLFIYNITAAPFFVFLSFWSLSFLVRKCYSNIFGWWWKPPVLGEIYLWLVILKTRRDFMRHHKGAADVLLVFWSSRLFMGFLVARDENLLAAVQDFRGDVRLEFPGVEESYGDEMAAMQYSSCPEEFHGPRTLANKSIRVKIVGHKLGMMSFRAFCII